MTTQIVIIYLHDILSIYLSANSGLLDFLVFGLQLVDLQQEFEIREMGREHV